MKNKILITGGAGFIGSNYVELIIENAEDQIYVLDNLTYAGSLKNLKTVSYLPNYNFIKGDICDEALINSLFKEYQFNKVVHFAAESHVDNSITRPGAFIQTNIVGTFNLLHSAYRLWMNDPNQLKEEYKDARFLHVSTDEVYGESSFEKNEANTESTSLLEPTNPYSATKAAAEMLVMAYGRSYDLPYIITRGNNVYGPHQYPEKAIPKFILLTRNSQKIPIHGDGLATRSYMHVRDAASAFDIILHKGIVRGVYNIGAREERTVLSVAHDIGNALGKDTTDLVLHVQDRKFNDRRYFIDCSKLLALGWTEQISWKEGLKETINWYSCNDQNSGYWGNLSGALIAHPTGGKPSLAE